jgi:hypothetical protein
MLFRSAVSLLPVVVPRGQQAVCLPSTCVAISGSLFITKWIARLVSRELANQAGLDALPIVPAAIVWKMRARETSFPVVTLFGMFSLLPESPMGRKESSCVDRERRESAWGPHSYSEGHGFFDRNTCGKWWRGGAFELSDTTWTLDASSFCLLKNTTLQLRGHFTLIG